MTPLDNYGAWKTPTLMPKEQASVTFDTPGTFGYRCSLHPGMRGTITVLDEAPSDGHAAGGLRGGRAATDPRSCCRCLPASSDWPSLRGVSVGPDVS